MARRITDSRATSILDVDLNIRAGCIPVKSAHSCQATLDGLLHQESSWQPSGTQQLVVSEKGVAFQTLPNSSAA